VLASVTNGVEQATTPPPGGKFVLTYDSNGPNEPAGGYSGETYIGKYALDATTGTAFGKFVITDPTSGQAVAVLYVAGSGSAGATGSKSGLVGLDVGAAPNAPDPTNPRLTVYGR
jgi:hypothetical protein